MTETPETDKLLSDQEFDRVPYDDAAIQLAELCHKLERERNEALHDATQQTIKVSLIKSRWIAARQALESIAAGTRCRECDGEDQARLAREGLEASK